MVSEELVLDVPLIEVGTRLRRTPNSNDRFWPCTSDERGGGMGEYWVRRLDVEEVIGKR